MGFVVRCKVCDERISVCPSRYNSRNNFFCSKKCEGIYKKSQNPNYIKCFICGDITYKKPHKRAKSKHPLCCSMDCMGELRKMIYLGEDNPNYGNTGLSNPMSKKRRVNQHGYIFVRVKNHPYSFDNGWIREHRLVAEKYLMENKHSLYLNGHYYLNPIFDVHHINFNRKDNRPENLRIMTRSDHMILHHKLRNDS